MSIEYIELTKEQWEDVDKNAKEMAKEYTKGFSYEKYGKGEIYEVEDRFEQREYGGNLQILESDLEDIINEVLNRDEKVDKYMVEGFYDLVIDFENWLSDELPNEWFVYYEDGDVWVARSWFDIEDIPEDLQHLVNE